MNEWYDIPSEETTLEQARSAVRELRKKVVEQFANMQNEWISVKNRLPEPKKDVLVYSEIEHPHKIRVDFLKASGQWFNSFHVTHWMPLPEMPKE